MLDIQESIAEGREVVEGLLIKEGIPFLGSTVVDLPDKGGVYLFSEQGTGKPLYVGQSELGLRSRMKDHWDGTTSSDLSRRLALEGVVRNRSDAKEWIRSNVVIRWVTRCELSMEIKWAEHFAIAVLRPDFNK